MASGLAGDIWAMRDDYAQVVMRQTSTADFINAHAGKKLTSQEAANLENLLAAQYETTAHALLGRLVLL